MPNKNLVSVIIPTKNSEHTIKKCLQSIQKQRYPLIEILIVDSFSQDETNTIASEFNVKVIMTRDKLLGARYSGLKQTKGQYVLLLDSDQILNEGTIAGAVHLMDNYDMLCLEEFTYEPRTWIQKLFEADRKLIHGTLNPNLDPVSGVLLPRFYQRKILEAGFKNIPKELMPFIVAHDHAIIYYETAQISQSVGILPNAIQHIEPATIMDLWKKNYRYGKSAKELARTGHYQRLLKEKVRFRKYPKTAKLTPLWIKSCFLLVLKAIAYKLGSWITL